MINVQCDSGERVLPAQICRARFHVPNEFPQVFLIPQVGLGINVQREAAIRADVVAGKLAGQFIDL